MVVVVHDSLVMIMAMRILLVRYIRQRRVVLMHHRGTVFATRVQHQRQRYFFCVYFSCVSRIVLHHQSSRNVKQDDHNRNHGCHLNHNHHFQHHHHELISFLTYQRYLPSPVFAFASSALVFQTIGV